jgi:hypothetical protein
MSHLPTMPTRIAGPQINLKPNPYRLLAQQLMANVRVLLGDLLIAYLLNPGIN